jgi:cell division protein FtsW (lipid II flippase)
LTESRGVERLDPDQTDPHPPDFFWWIRQIVFFFLGCFFMIFGILILVSSYRLNEPHLFIMTFFASNFMILISATLTFIFAYRMKPYLIKSRGTREEQDRPGVD